MNGEHSNAPAPLATDHVALLACPFCGGEASFGTVRYSQRMIKEQGWDNDTFHFVNCTRCGISNQGLTGFSSQAVAAEKWNRRELSLTPTPMLLWCPECGDRHIDVGEFATKVHHTHACQSCGMVWRPAIGPTFGVQWLPGFKNER